MGDSCKALEDSSLINPEPTPSAHIRELCSDPLSIMTITTKKNTQLNKTPLTFLLMEALRYQIDGVSVALDIGHAITIHFQTIDMCKVIADH